jgi:hypothetical protein
MMTQDEYAAWWIAWGDSDDLPEPVSTLVDHVAALQDRIDRLPEDLSCCCAYDHPDAVCMIHAKRQRDAS